MCQSEQKLLSKGSRNSIALFAIAAITMGAMTSEVAAQAAARAGANFRATRLRQPVRPLDVIPEQQAPIANSEFGSALLAWDKDARAAADSIALPGARGDLKLDKCYRGRDHLMCNLNVLTKEATVLSQEFNKIIEAGYPDLGNIGAICAIKPDSLGFDMNRAGEFNQRFRALKAAYSARMSCTAKIQQQMREVTLPDMARAPDV